MTLKEVRDIDFNQFLEEAANMSVLDNHIWQVFPPILVIDFDGPLNASRDQNKF